MHYTMWSPCSKAGYGTASNTIAPTGCVNNPACYKDTTEFLLNSGYRDVPELRSGVIGIAKDGHLILGPYNPESGELWSCDEHDICNGVFLSDGSYAYVATGTYPYTVGCWGPGSTQIFETKCSQRSCGAPLGSI